MRRHTFAEGEDPAAGHTLRLDPGALPVRYLTKLSGTASEAPAAVVIDRHQVVISQTRDGVPTVVTVPIKSYLGIAAHFESLEDGAMRVTVELSHDNPELSLPLAISFDTDALAEDWEEWGHALDLPLFLPDTVGRLRVVHDAEPAEPIDGPAPRRARGALRQRRPRFARRRKTGEMPRLKVIAGREIIARD